jgi:acyl-CoA synthetase (NDP forming)
VGKGISGARAASSHTASIAGEPERYSAVFRQLGIIEADSFDEMVDFATALAGARLPKNNRVAIIAGPVGPAVSTADTCERVGLEVPELSEATKEKLRKVLPPFAGLSNPIDMTTMIIPSPDIQRLATEIVLQDEKIGGVIEIMPALHNIPSVAQRLIAAAQKSEKPMVVGQLYPLMYPEVHESAQALHSHGIPCLPTPERAARAYGALVRYAEFLRKKGVRGMTD